MESHQAKGFLPSACVIAAAPGSLPALLFFSWHSSYLWYSVCMAGCQPSQVQRLLSMSQFQISGEGTLDHLEPGCMARLINWGQRNCVPLLIMAARDAQRARHALQKYIAISNMKFLVILIYMLLYSKTSFIIKSINLLWQLFPGKTNIILNLYILRAYKFLFVHTTYHFLIQYQYDHNFILCFSYKVQK